MIKLINHTKIIFLGFLSIILITGCSSLNVDNIKIPGLTSRPADLSKIQTTIDQSKEYFGMGVYPIGESGRIIATNESLHRAKVNLENELKKQIGKLLDEYLLEIHFYSSSVKKKIKVGLSQAIASDLVKKYDKKDSWIDDDKVYTIVAIKKDKIAIDTTKIFLSHIENRIQELNKLRTKIMEKSQNYLMLNGMNEDSNEEVNKVHSNEQHIIDDESNNGSVNDLAPEAEIKDENETDIESVKTEDGKVIDIEI